MESFDLGVPRVSEGCLRVVGVEGDWSCMLYKPCRNQPPTRLVVLQRNHWTNFSVGRHELRPSNAVWRVELGADEHSVQPAHAPGALRKDCIAKTGAPLLKCLTIGASKRA